jgi:hypothetical protein
MPPRAKVDLLPAPVREELERRLVAGGFSGYRELAEWLTGQGFAISKSSLHDWGQSFEDRLSSLKVVTEQARAVVEAAPDREGALNDALIRLVQEKLFLVLAELQVDPRKIKIGNVAKMVADLARPAISQKRLAAEVRKEIEAEMRRKLDEAAASGGFDPQAAEEARRILGFA